MNTPTPLNFTTLKVDKSLVKAESATSILVLVDKLGFWFPKKWVGTSVYTNILDININRDYSITYVNWINEGYVSGTNKLLSGPADLIVNNYLLKFVKKEKITAV